MRSPSSSRVSFPVIKDMRDTLFSWETMGITFMSIREQVDTSTALGRLLLNLLASLAEFELELIRERVKAGMDRAANQIKEHVAFDRRKGVQIKI